MGDEEQWMWRGVILGLATARIIGDKHYFRGWPFVAAEINKQSIDVRRHLDTSQTSMGEAEYRSWKTPADG
jgi:hypothetical protein